MGSHWKSTNVTRTCDKETNKPKETFSTYGNKDNKKTSSTSK